MTVRCWLTAFAAAVALLTATSAHAANLPSPILDAAATQVAGHPVTVWCESSDTAWVQLERQHGIVGDDDGFTVPAVPVVYLSPTVCTVLHADLTDGVETGGLYWSSEAIKTLIHESIHQRGVTDETQTDCTALTLVDSIAEQFFGVTATVQQTSYHSRTVKVKGVRVQTFAPVIVTVANPLLTQLQTWAQVWHDANPEFGAC